MNGFSTLHYPSMFLVVDFHCITSRDEIAGCSEKAYDYLSISDARQMLLFPSENELLEYIKEVLVSSALIFFIFTFKHLDLNDLIF
jgi:hypothetical protein